MADNVTLNSGSGGDSVGADDISGVKYQRVKLIHGVDGTNEGDIATSKPLPVQIINTGRTEKRYYAVAAATGTTGTETAITLTASSGTSATTTGVSFAVTSAKRFKINSITLMSRGNATGTAQISVFNLRINTAGAVTTTSTPVILSARTTNGATNNEFDRVFIDCGPDGIEIPGDGTLQWGITAAATYTTNAPTWDVLILGYEY